MLQTARARFTAAAGRRFVTAERGLHVIASSLCALVFFAFFEDLVTYTILNRSLMSGDDAYYAMVSKSLAFRGAYGLPMSSVHVSLFEPTIGTGPAMIVPGTIMMRIFGPQFWVPGATAHILFLAQMAGVVAILARRVGVGKSLAFVTAAVALMQVMSGHRWYLPSYLGEAQAFGYFALGAALLMTGSGARRLACAGALFGLAYLTKQVSLFAALGVVTVWAGFALRDSGFKGLARAGGMLLVGGLAPLVLFEAYKLMTLGPSGYADLFARQMSVHAKFGVDQVAEDRAARFLEIAVGRYLASWRTLAFIAIAAVAAVLLWVRSPGVRARLRLAAFMWAGTATFLAYFLFVAPMYDRYLAIGVYTLAAALAAPFLALNLRWSAVFGACLYVVMMLGVDLAHGFRGMPPTRPEQAEVVEAIVARPHYPIAARSWHSSFDVLYVLEQEREWVDAAQIERFRGREFVFVALMPFVPSNDEFMDRIFSKCSPIPLHGERYQLRQCGLNYWDRP